MKEIQLTQNQIAIIDDDDLQKEYSTIPALTSNADITAFPTPPRQWQGSREPGVLIVVRNRPAKAAYRGKEYRNCRSIPALYGVGRSKTYA